MSGTHRASRRRVFALAALLLVLAVGGAIAPAALVGDPVVPVRGGLGMAGVGVARAAVPRPHFPAVVVGHRGAPAYRPEHTLAGYQLAIDQGADYVEPDLVSTKDGFLIARHEGDLAVTTDVREHPELGGRRYAEQLTLAEIKTLRAGGQEIPTLGEIITLLRAQSRHVGLYLELKTPGHFRRLGLPMEETLAAMLRAEGWTEQHTPVFVASFEAASLRRMRELLPEMRLARNVDNAEALDAARLDEIAGYASVLSVNRDRLRPGNTDASALVTDARSHGLEVHVWTLGADCPFGVLPAAFGHPADPAPWSDTVRMYRAYYAMGVTAVFSDAPDIAVWARG